jgi:beta-mannosidase
LIRWPTICYNSLELILLKRNKIKGGVLSLEVIDLCGTWEFCGFEEGEGELRGAFGKDGPGEWREAKVPGVVHLDLIAHEMIPDPFFGRNEIEVQWVEEREWWYRRKFQVGESILEHELIELVAEGLDTFATIYINGNKVAFLDNMFIEHRIQIEDYLVPGENTIAIRFDSPTRYLEEVERRKGKLGAAFYTPRVYGRKAQYSFGWDWGPRLPTCGIWRPIRIEAFDVARISGIFPKVVEISGKEARINLKVELEALSREVETSLHIEIGMNGLVLAKSVPIRISEPGHIEEEIPIAISDPKLWWPAGMGEQALYTCTASLKSRGRVIGQKRIRFGIRDIKLLREPDVEGESFTFAVNGIPVFCKGANWVPADSFLPSVSRERYEKLLSMAVKSNMNMLRVWGGGIYESEDFYDLCDELGILIWQDFMFACAEYPEERWFHEKVEEEARAVVRRLRSHPSIALWCGNNENDWGYEAGWWGKKDVFYGRTIYHEILPRICEELDGTRPYWPSSPYGGYQNNGQEAGDRHAWDVWSGWQDYINYKHDNGRFISEFGFQAPPTLKTIESFTEPQDRHPQSEVMEHHNKMYEGTERLFRFLAAHIPIPSSFEEFVIKAQINQGLALKTGIEHWRTRKFMTSGALFWQLNDCWPVSSWSVIDYALRPKPAYYYVKRAFSPVHAVPVDEDDHVSLYIINDTLQPKELLLEADLFDVDGTRKWEARAKLVIPPNCSRKVRSWRKEDIALQSRKRDVLFVRIFESDGKIPCSENALLFSRIKHMELPTPDIKVTSLELNGDIAELEICSDVVTLAVELKLDGIEAEYSDNFFDLAPNVPKLITIKLPKPIPMEELRQSLKLGARLP